MGNMVKAQNGQTLLDIALQTSGHNEGVFDLAIANGWAVTEEVATNSFVKTVAVLKQDIVSRYASLGIYPASNIGGTYAPTGFSFTAFAPPKTQTVLVAEGQEIVDVALMETGGIESAFEVAHRLGIAITDALRAGIDRVLTPDSVYKNRVLRFYSERGIIPATHLDKTYLPAGVNYWGIEFDFIIS
jgi:hypothetical protein